jgi:hypothetical protein
MRKIIFSLALIVVLTSQVHGTRCDICRLDTCKTFYSTDQDQVGERMKDNYDMQLAKQSKSSLYVNRSNFEIVEMMQASMVTGSLDYLSTQGEVSESTSHARVYSDSLKLKDPNTAAFYALVPGFFVHGAGHFYAGRSKTGALLFGIEMLSGLSLYLFALSNLPNGEPDDTRRAAYVSVAAGLFLGSWYYDIMKSPHAVKEYNEKLRTKTE